MKLTVENVINLPISEKDKLLIYALLSDLKELNQASNKSPLYIDWQDFHTEYSPEWTDPCPDYYGYYTLRFENNPYEIVGIEMTLDDLDNALCLLYEFVTL